MAEYHRAETILTSKLPPPKLPPLHSRQMHNTADRVNGAVPTASTRQWTGTPTASTVDLGPSDRNLSPSDGHKQGLRSPRQLDESTISSFAGGLWGAVARTPNFKSGLDVEAENRAELAYSGGTMVDWSMACRYLATLCLVCHM